MISHHFLMELEDICISLIEEMTHYELVTSLRVWSEQNLGGKLLFDSYLTKIDEVLQEFGIDDTVTCIYCLKLVKNADAEKLNTVLNKLKERAVVLQQQLKVQSSTELDKDEEVEEYLANVEIEKLKNQ